jgi:hypothetical protein
MTILQQIERELDDYLHGTVTISDGVQFSQYKLVKRIALYANKIYPKGKLTKRGEYKYWFDIIQPRIDSEVKNIDFDTKDITLVSDRKIDQVPLLIANARIKGYLKETGQAEQLNSAIEEGSGWGNVVFKKIKGSYERADLKNFFVINQTAECLDDSPVIERQEMTAADVRAKARVWDNVNDVLQSFWYEKRNPTATSSQNESTLRIYNIFERNGEVSEKALFEAQGKQGGDENKFLLAKIIVACKSNDGSGAKKVLYAQPLSGKMCDIYKEYHRGRYAGRWLREGLYEILMDCQTRGNEIGNQLARGLEWASKTFFYTKDRLIVQNILTDINNGDMIKAEMIAQVPVRMEGFDQLVADWNRIVQIANDLANSREIVMGATMPSGTSFRMGAMLNANANKLFEFIREKLAITFTDVFHDWILPELLKDLKAKDIMKITGDPSLMDRFYDVLANTWYIDNLPSLPPHGPDAQQFLIEQEKERLQQRGDLFIQLSQEIWADFEPSVSVNITGENVNLEGDLETLSTFIALEQDPVRRTALIEMAMDKKGIDVGSLPKSLPQQLMPPATNGPAASPSPTSPAPQNVPSPQPTNKQIVATGKR